MSRQRGAAVKSKGPRLRTARLCSAVRRNEGQDPRATKCTAATPAKLFPRCHLLSARGSTSESPALRARLWGSPDHFAGPEHAAAECLPGHLQHKSVTLLRLSEPGIPGRSDPRPLRHRRAARNVLTMYSRRTRDALTMYSRSVSAEQCVPSAASIGRRMYFSANTGCGCLTHNGRTDATTSQGRPSDWLVP